MCRSSESRIRIRYDHVLEEMLRGLGAKVTPLEAAFDPEAGAPHMTARIITATTMAKKKNLPLVKGRRGPGPLGTAGESVPEQATEGAALYRLMTWLSPSYPVGAFSYSSGIEWAVEAGDITDAADAQELAHGDDRRGRRLLRRRVLPSCA